MEKKPTQRDLVREQLLAGNELTSISAYHLCKHTTRLSAIIYDLRNEENLNIQMERRKSSDGESTYGVYWIDRKDLDNIDTQLTLFNN